MRSHGQAEAYFAATMTKVRDKKNEIEGDGHPAETEEK